jgi:hypothetical protein
VSFLEDFGELLTQQVTREPVSSEDKYGQPSYGAPTVLRCRVVSKPRLVRSVSAARSETEGSVREVVSTAQVWTEPVQWGVDDRITLPDGTQPIILHVERYPDETGPHHEVVYV